MGPPRASLKRWVPRSHGVACRGLRNRDGENDVISIPKGLPRAIRLPTASSSGPGGRNPLPNDLLPAVEAVSGGALLLFDRPLFLVRTAAGGQLPLEGVEDLGNAVVELNARESRCRGDLRISLRCLAPRGEDRLASRLQMGCEIRQRVGRPGVVQLFA